MKEKMGDLRGLTSLMMVGESRAMVGPACCKCVTIRTDVYPQLTGLGSILERPLNCEM